MQMGLGSNLSPFPPPWASPRLHHHHSLGLVSQLKPKPKTSSPSPLASPPAYQPHRELPPPAARRREELWRRSSGIQKILPPSLMTDTTVHMVGAGRGEPCACVEEESVRCLGVRLLPVWSVEGKLQAMSDGGRGMVVRRPSDASMAR